MPKDIEERKYWEILCGALMFVALGFTLFGSIAFVKSKGGLGDALFFLIWGFGFIGMLIFHLENAFGKLPLTIIGLGWSAGATIWNYITYRCPDNEICAYDSSGSAILIAVCLVSLGALLAYDKKKDKIPRVGAIAIKILTRLMLTEV
jgi:hypothetical protein